MFRGSTHVVTMALALLIIVGVAAADVTHNPAGSLPATLKISGGEAATGPQFRLGGPEFVSLSVADANDQPVTIVVREGELATYKSFSQEESFGLLPTVDERTGEVIVQVVSSTGEQPSYHVLEMQELKAPVGFQVVTSTADRLVPLSLTPVVISACERLALSSGARCEAAEIHPRGSLFISDALRPAPGGGTCCVSCGGGQWCGCSVSTPCGSCTGGC